MMSAEKWTFNEDADGDHAIFSETGKLIAVTVGWENSAASWTKEEDASNARLLASAPQMLEALKSLFAESGAGMGIAEDEIRAAIGNTNWNCLQLAREKAQNAIKLAEGDL